MISSTDWYIKTTFYDLIVVDVRREGFKAINCLALFLHSQALVGGFHIVLQFVLL